MFALHLVPVEAVEIEADERPGLSDIQRRVLASCTREEIEVAIEQVGAHYDDVLAQFHDEIQGGAVRLLLSDKGVADDHL